jgi:glucokinase
MPEWPPQSSDAPGGSGPRRVIGIDAGGTKMLGGVVDRDLVVHHRVHRLWRGADRSEVLDIMVEEVDEARAAAPDAEAVGFGLPSLMDSEHGTSVSSVHLPLDDVPFRDLMSERLGMPVFVDNDANAAGVAEQRAGAARGALDVVLLTLGTGIGGALILGGKIYRGSAGFAGELGHMTVDLDGDEHPGECENHGCLEALVSGQAMARAGEEAARREPASGLGSALAQSREITGALVTELAHDGDEVARGVVQLLGRRLGAGLVSVVNVFNPEVIVIGGGAAASGELLLEPARQVVAERALRPARQLARVVPAHFGEEAGMIGAAMLALDRGAA